MDVTTTMSGETPEEVKANIVQFIRERAKARDKQRWMDKTLREKVVSQAIVAVLNDLANSVENLKLTEGTQP